MEAIVGCVLGLAVGDALGVPVEGCHGDVAIDRLSTREDAQGAEESEGESSEEDKEEEEEEEEEETSDEDDSTHPGHPSPQSKIKLEMVSSSSSTSKSRGLYSDDTQFALCLVQPIFELGRFDPHRSMQVFARLRNTKSRGGFGVFRGTGRGSREAIGKMVVGDCDWFACGIPSAGNGAAMRAGPLAAFTALRVLASQRKLNRSGSGSEERGDGSRAENSGSDVDEGVAEDDDKEERDEERDGIDEQKNIEKMWIKVARATIQGALLTHRDPRGISAALAIAAGCAYHITRSKIDPSTMRDATEKDEDEGEDEEEGEQRTAREDARRFLEQVATWCSIGEDIMLKEWKEHLLFPVETITVRGNDKGGRGKGKGGGDKKSDRRRRDNQQKGKENSSRARRRDDARQKQQVQKADMRAVHQFSNAVRGLSKMIGWDLDSVGQVLVKKAQKLSSQKIAHPCQGFAFCSVLMALLVAAQATSFEDAVTTAIGLGGDCDTMGAMVGSIAGCRWGVRRIPERWRDQVANTDALVSRGQHLAALALGLITPQPLDVPQQSSTEGVIEPGDEVDDGDGKSEGEDGEEEVGENGVGEVRAGSCCCCEAHTLDELASMEANPTVTF